ncbi:hypothetical protein VB005_06699 [Metarhizium brunneum]
MFLPTLRPPLASEQSPEQLPSPPATSSPHKPPLRNGPFEHLPALYIPGHTYDDVLLAQEIAEDDQLQTRATNMWRESQINSCAEDNKTTPWLQHTFQSDFRVRRGRVITWLRFLKEHYPDYRYITISPSRINALLIDNNVFLLFAFILDSDLSNKAQDQPVLADLPPLNS